VRFVVTGCARSGTKYTATLLRALGLECGHEQIFDGRGVVVDRSLAGDSSWLAVPFLDAVPETTIVVHQTRSPVDAIRSLRDTRLFRRFAVEDNLPKHVAKRLAARPPSGDHRHRAFVREHCPEAFVDRDELTRATRHWIAWNRAVRDSCDRRGLPYQHVRLEDLDAARVARLADLLDAPGRDRDRVLDALDAVPRNTNARARKTEFDPNALPDEVFDDLVVAARDHGYEL
jgi:hypothetical protein